MTRAPSYTYLWPRRRSFRGTEVGLVREIVSAIGDWWSLIGQVTFPLQFSRVIPPTPALCCGPAPKGSLLLTEIPFSVSRFTRPFVRNFVPLFRSLNRRCDEV